MCFKPQPQLFTRTSTGGLWAVFGESMQHTPPSYHFILEIQWSNGSIYHICGNDNASARHFCLLQENCKITVWFEVFVRWISLPYKHEWRKIRTFNTCPGGQCCSHNAWIKPETKRANVIPARYWHYMIIF